MADKVKVLICGDVEGQFNILFNKVQNICKKSGQFDLLLCVGNFFGINNNEFLPYQNGLKKIPIATYILGPNKEDHVELYPNEGSDICDNIYYLGKSGLYTVTGGLKIAYLSGTLATSNNCINGFNYTTQDVIHLRDVCLRNNLNYKGIDILLTSQWPDGVTSNTKSEISVLNSSPHIAWLAYQLKPRYHICGLEGMYFERPPYRNASDNEFSIATRFLSLARVGNPNKSKWIYAANLTPLEKMKVSELMQKTIDETENPYNIDNLESLMELKKRKSSSQQQYFYDMSDPQNNTNKKHRKRPKIEFDQSKCWFCLASPSVEKHLVITVGTSIYLAAAKGGLVDEHLLICPIEHHQSLVELEDDIIEEIDRFKDALRKFYDRNNNVAVFFERNFKTSHMQIQVIPIPREATKELKIILQEEAQGHGFELMELNKGTTIKDIVQPKTPYFVVELPEGEMLYTILSGHKGFSINFAREVLASGPVLNMPDRIEWKDCTASKEDEAAMINRIRNDFEPFDISD